MSCGPKGMLFELSAELGGTASESAQRHKPSGLNSRLTGAGHAPHRTSQRPTERTIHSRFRKPRKNSPGEIAGAWLTNNLRAHDKRNRDVVV